uniref:Pleiotrophin/Midkine C-terminal domain-containing protein n=1 Tax=Romanomermis culicivorax TaxID=13658 RepID=A0A915JDE4_ROMCU
MAAQSTICLIFCIFAIFYYVESKSPKSRQRQNDSNNCKNVEWGPCQNLTKQNGVCGHGIKKGKGAGVGCENIERQCKVACPECRYNRGDFGDCDKISAKRSRVDILDESNSDARCQKERTIEKPCRKNNSNVYVMINKL